MVYQLINALKRLKIMHQFKKIQQFQQFVKRFNKKRVCASVCLSATGSLHRFHKKGNKRLEKIYRISIRLSFIIWCFDIKWTRITTAIKYRPPVFVCGLFAAKTSLWSALKMHLRLQYQPHSTPPATIYKIMIITCRAAGGYETSRKSNWV